MAAMTVFPRFLGAPCTLLVCALTAWAAQACQAAEPPLSLATFQADVTPPVGHPLQGGVGVQPVAEVADPLLAHGIVLLGSGQPIVIVAVDWCGIGNDAHDAWRTALAEAAGTTSERVLVSALHQHDAPLADLTAERQIAELKLGRGTLDLAFHQRAVEKTAAALKASLARAQPLTHIGLGQAQVEKVASNRRILGDDGKVVLVRGSSSKDPRAKEAPKGTIDPWLKTISFFSADKPLASLSVYATHPMSYYGRGQVSSDFCGLARQRRQADDPGVLHFYATGCGGNVAAGKYNDGSPEIRPILTDRMHAAMKAAWDATNKHPIETVRFRSVPLRLPAKTTGRFERSELERMLRDPNETFDNRARVAYALSWRERSDAAGQALDIPALDFGVAQIVLLPGEPFVEYQLAAQKLRPDSFVVVLGYGDYGPVYLPTDIAFGEGGYEPGDWSFVAPGAEASLLKGLATALEE
jgi:hypothetical protein